VAKLQPGEPVTGALQRLMVKLRDELAQQSLTNDLLEGKPELHTLIDGIDAALIDLAAEELGEEELVQMAAALAGRTFAAQNARSSSMELMRTVFTLRARRVAAIRAAGRLEWIRETGTRARMLDSVESVLFPLRDSWDKVTLPTDPQLSDAMLTWAWVLPGMKEAMSDAFHEIPSFDDFAMMLRMWLDGKPLVEIAHHAQLDINTMLSVHAKILSYVLPTAVEQGISLLRKLVEANGDELSQVMATFPEHLKYGVPTTAARILAAGGIRHRRAAVAIGQAIEMDVIAADDRLLVFTAALALLDDRERWLPQLGQLVLKNTIVDLKAMVAGTQTN
jgi:helicase